ncbi:AMP-binding protein [Bosea sp. 2YAB26]|uniref:AMP-binding protein n=1 Tax=Bosea sp. 2YAB26 TaxID=3237478 RepID=UPI003F917B3F
MSAEISFPARLAQLAAEAPDIVAITFVDRDGQETDVTRRDLHLRATRLARVLAQRGVGPDTMVVTGIPNSIEHIAIAIAAWRCGACTVAQSARAPEREFAETLKLLDARFVIADRAGADMSHAEIRAVSLDDSRDAEPVPDRVAHPGKATASGGSTGRPKIIVYPHPWVRVPGEIGDISHIGFRSGQIQLVCGPLYHNAPFTWAHFGLFEGHRLILMERFDAARVVDLIEHHRCSFMFFAPTMMQRIIRLPEIQSRDLSSIGSIFITAAICPVWLKQAWVDLIGAEKLQESYGSSEAVGYAHISGPEWLSHRGSVGRAGDGDLKILDAEFNEVPTGEIGEIFFRPTHYPRPTYAYIGSPPAKTTPNGYTSVGDMGHVDAEGFLYIADRRTDLIISGGVNVYPAEVEAVLTEHAAVGDAAVVGLPDADWGRRVHAIVEPVDPSGTIALDELYAWMRERLSAAKIPKTIEFTSALPRDQSGKIRRSALIAARTPEGLSQ